MEKFDIALVARYLAGEANAEERHLVKEWKRTNPQAFKDYQKIWSAGASSDFDPVVRFDKAAAWQKTAGQLDLTEPGKSSTRTPRVRSLGFWLSRIAAVFIIGLGIAYLLRPNLPEVSPEVVFSAEDGPQTLELPDGSSLNLQVGTILTYPDNFKEDRSVSLKGVAFFDVAKDERLPFTVKTDHLLVTVTGTSFYVDENKEEVGVSTGSVKVNDRNSGQSVFLGPGERVSFDTENMALSDISATEENQLFWKTGIISFKDQSLEKVFTTLESAYGAVFEYDREAAGKCRFTGRFKDVTLTTIIEQLETSLELKISKQDSLSYIVPISTCE